MKEHAFLVDCHAHLDDSKFAADLDKVTERAVAAGVVGIVTAAVDLASSRAALGLAKRHGVVAAVGIHPNEARQWCEASLPELRSLASDDHVVAIGETGLDYYRDRTPRNTQQESFRAHLRLGRELALPVVVHNRDASEDVLRIIAEEAAQAPLAVMLHCFAEDRAFAEAAVALGCYISIAGPITYPKTEQFVEVVRSVPSDRLLVETDCPYLTPQPVRGKRNEPAYVRYTAERIAQITCLPFADVARQTTANALRLFGDRLARELPGELRDTIPS